MSQFSIDRDFVMDIENYIRIRSIPRDPYIMELIRKHDEKRFTKIERSKIDYREFMSDEIKNRYIIR